MKKIFLMFVVIAIALTASSQSSYAFRGKVTDEKYNPLTGAYITIFELKKGTVTDKNGQFEIDNIPVGEYHLHISYLGYMCVHHQTLEIKNADVYKEFNMQPENVDINEIVVTGSISELKKNKSTVSIEIVNQDFIMKNTNSSLMKSLENLPGVSAMTVGQGFAKPVIRGLSFNRVAVSENGIKQEGQQWGADHGLEIDQFAIENVEIIKGPASLAFGSDAIGGVVQILPNKIPDTNSINASVQFISKSVNDLFGFSAMTKYRKQKWNFYLRYTQLDFADYKVPADSFFYNRFRLPIYDSRLKNTAGKERDLYFSTGWQFSKLKTSFAISNVYSKAGFFPGSHGIPDANKLLPDSSFRNIDLPFQAVNHFKVVNNTYIQTNYGELEFNIGYQNNFRQEWSMFHTHYPTQTAPDINPDLELQFNLDTWSGEAKFSRKNTKSGFNTGISAQYQINEIAGYMFLLPNYLRSAYGVFITEKVRLNEKLNISGGLRFDYGNIQIKEYFSEYTERFKSTNFNGNYYDFSWALGLSYNLNDKLNFKTNLGKSFRMPNASELSANGIHHGSFRYEVGDTNIVSEYSYQLDAGLYFNSDKIDFEISPFMNYFPNFIFLSPTGSYLHPEGYEIEEADAGQVYQYIQSEAFRAGGEFSLGYKPIKDLRISTVAEYVYATDFTYPIPFTPPFNLFSELDYKLKLPFKFTESLNFNVNNSLKAAQNRNARNELETPASSIWGASVSTNIKFKTNRISVVFQVQNLFNTKYYDHLSFYRIIELPEAGRNFQVSVKWEI